MLGKKELLKPFSDEVLRWNRQFSLISRVNPEQRLAELISESIEAHSVACQHIATQTDIHKYNKLNYFDIGSGAGFPGIIWQALWEQAGTDIDGQLVEPREKRAWFLERCVRKLNLRRLEIDNNKWGQNTPPVAKQNSKTLNIISLKALYLTDSHILTHVSNDCDVIIMRFHNPETELDKKLIDHLKLSPGAEVVKFTYEQKESALLISSRINCST